MRILLNFLPLLGRGGGRQNAFNLWRAIAEHDSGHEWTALARPELPIGQLRAAPWQEVRTVEARSLLRRLWLDNMLLPRLARETNADVLFTPMGVGPLRPPVPSVVGWHDSTVVYPESPMWAKVSLRKRATARLRARYARARVARADVVCVQTLVMARRLSHAWRIPLERFRIVPNGPSEFLRGELPRDERPPGPARVLVVATDQPAKNLDVLEPVGRALGELGETDVEIVVTVRSPNAQRPSSFGSAVPVRWLGQVPHAELAQLYRSADVVFVPSFMESFSAVYVEAWQFQVPLVTSDLDFARELCGSAAVYAPPTNARVLAAVIQRVLGSEVERDRLVAEGTRRFEALPSWRERLERYVSAVEAAGLHC